jgi:hypothetical protein
MLAPGTSGTVNITFTVGANGIGVLWKRNGERAGTSGAQTGAGEIPALY